MKKIILTQIPVGHMQNFAYVLVDSASKKAAVVDPGWDAEKIVSVLEEAGADLSAVWLTHTHFDHVKALPGILAYKKVPVYVHPLEREMLKTENADVQDLSDGLHLKLGESQVICHHTPGHSPGMICFEGEDFLITGDMLFIDACGRVDLPGSSPEDMQKSLEKLRTLSDELIVYPGHDYGKTPSASLGEQKKTNPFLQENVRMKG